MSLDQTLFLHALLISEVIIFMKTDFIKLAGVNAVVCSKNLEQFEVIDPSVEGNLAVFLSCVTGSGKDGMNKKEEPWGWRIVGPTL